MRFLCCKNLSCDPGRIIGLMFLLAVLSALSPAAANDTNPADQPIFIFWEFDCEEALRLAAQKNTFVVAYVYSNGCDWCCKMEEDTFSDSDVVQLSRHYMFSKHNLDHPASDWVKEKYQVNTTPTILVLSSAGEEVFRASAYLSAPELIAALSQFSQPSAAPVETEFQDQPSVQFCFEYAQKAFKHLEFMEATKALDHILYIDPENSQGMNDQVLHLFGTSLVYLHQLEAGEILLARLCNEFPKSRVVPDAMYILGEIYIQTNRPTLGRNLLKKLMQEHPEHIMARKAEMALQRMFGKNGGGSTG